MPILTGICLSSFVFGTLYAVMHWTETLFAVYVPIVFLVFISLTLLIGLLNEIHKKFSKHNLLRVLVVLLIGITSVILSQANDLHGTVSRFANHVFRRCNRYCSLCHSRIHAGQIIKRKYYLLILYHHERLY